MKNTFGNQVSLTIFGESHGPAIGAVLDGLAAGLPVDEAHIARWMDRRRARGDGLSTSRKEPETVRFLSGVYNGRTTGTALTLMIENTAQRSGDYAKTAGLARPGHADYTAHVKYQGFEDFRGGGHFSGRLTAPLVAAGALCQSILAAKGVRIGTHLYRLAGLDDQPFAEGEEKLAAQLAALEEREGFALLDPSREEAMKAAVRTAAAEGDSVGGILETAVLGLPAGAGEPFFDSAESVLSHLLFSIPAVIGVEFGAGFGFADLKGSEANDPLHMRNGEVVSPTNHSGGVNGGITNGLPILFEAALRPTASIAREQDTVNLDSWTDSKLIIQGRHDPCIVHRAVPVIEAAAALAVCQLMGI